VEQQHGIPVITIATLHDLIEWLHKEPGMQQNLLAIEEYRKLHGVRNHA
jgi:orotate phosphoribosyltransferase